MAPFESMLRTDLINEDLLVEQEKVRVVIDEYYNIIINSAIPVNKSTSIYPSKDIIEVMELIQKTIIDYEDVTHATEDRKIDVIYEDPDRDIEVESISISFVAREPGSFSQGRPGEGKVKNRRPILMEEFEDPDNPGYKRAVLAYFYDNILRLTAWARTNKEANARAVWLENLMEEYSWFFAASGVERFLFDGWKPHKKIEINGNRYYGRPIDFFVRTQKLWNLSQKKLEEIYIRLALGPH